MEAALTLACLGKKDASRGLLSKAEACGRDNGEILYVVARVQAELGDVAAAKTTLDSAFAAHAGPTEREVAIDPHFQVFATQGSQGPDDDICILRRCGGGCLGNGSLRIDGRNTCLRIIHQLDGPVTVVV